MKETVANDYPMFVEFYQSVCWFCVILQSDTNELINKVADKCFYEQIIDSYT